VYVVQTNPKMECECKGFIGSKLELKIYKKKMLIKIREAKKA